MLVIYDIKTFSYLIIVGGSNSALMYNKLKIFDCESALHEKKKKDVALKY